MTYPARAEQIHATHTFFLLSLLYYSLLHPLLPFLHALFRQLSSHTVCIMNVLFAVSSQQLLLPFAVYCMVNSRIELGIQCRPVSQPALLCCQCVGPVTHITQPCRALCEIFSQNQKLSYLVYGGSYMCCVYRVDILLALVPAAIACQISYLYYVHRLYPPIVVIHRAPH